MHQGRGDVFEQVVVGDRGLVELGATGGGGTPALLDGGAKALSKLGGFDVNRLARHEWSIHSTHKRWLTSSLLQVARIAAGEFVMGADDGDEDERPPHRAYIDEFCIGTIQSPTPSTRSSCARHGSSLSSNRAASLMVSGALEGEFRTLAAAYCWNNGTPA